MAGWGRTLGIIVGGGVGVDLYEPGHIRRGYAKRPQVTSFYVGEPSGMITKRSRELAAIMNDVDTAKATDNLWGERWTKLCVNAMRNGVSAATGIAASATVVNEPPSSKRMPEPVSSRARATVSLALALSSATTSSTASGRTRTAVER